MHRPTDPIASPIRARIHERALSRVTKLFNAGLGDIFAELFQNARRAGAGRLDVNLVDQCLCLQSADVLQRQGVAVKILFRQLVRIGYGETSYPGGCQP